MVESLSYSNKRNTGNKGDTNWKRFADDIIISINIIKTPPEMPRADKPIQLGSRIQN